MISKRKKTFLWSLAEQYLVVSVGMILNTNLGFTIYRTLTIGFKQEVNKGLFQYLQISYWKLGKNNNEHLGGE